jgi:nucleoside-diphosphate-sugar epimerase
MNSDYSKPVNIGSDRLVTIDEVADMLIKISSKEIVKVYDTSKPQGVRGRNADLSFVTRLLDWKPTVSLEDGLQKTYIWIEKRSQEDKNKRRQHAVKKR